MATILVTGANGQLGSELRDIFRNESTYDVIYTDQSELNITDSKAVFSFLETNDVSLIINCAAYTAVDKAEDEPLLCEEVNSKAPGILADACAKLGIFMIHVSTDYVFDGMGPVPYNEDKPASPSGVYGMTKLNGEKAVGFSGCDYIIIRTSWLYSVYGNNFAKTILRLAQERDSLNVVFDQVGTPTYAADLADVIFKISSLITDAKESGNSHRIDSGIYHFSNEGVCSWYDFACEIVKLSGEDCKVMPVTSEMFPTKARRPSYSVLNKAKIKQVYGIEITHWRDSLNIFYNRLINLKSNHN